MNDAYRFLIPEKLTPEVLLHAARRLAEAQSIGHDLSRAIIEGKFIVVPCGNVRREKAAKEGPNRFEQADQYRAQIVEYLTPRGAARACEIGRAVHLTTGQLTWLLGTLISMGRLERVGLTYRIKGANAA